MSRGTGSAVAGREQIWMLADHSPLAAAIEPAGRHDRCWLPRTSIATGDIRIHEIAWGIDEHGEPKLWLANALFSCLRSFAARTEMNRGRQRGTKL